MSSIYKNCIENSYFTQVYCHSDAVSVCSCVNKYVWEKYHNLRVSESMRQKQIVCVQRLWEHFFFLISFSPFRITSVIQSDVILHDHTIFCQSCPYHCFHMGGALLENSDLLLCTNQHLANFKWKSDDYWWALCQSYHLHSFWKLSC